MRGARLLTLTGAALLGASAAPDPLAAERERLATAKRDAAAALLRAEALERSSASERDAARKARAEEAAVAERIRRAEAEIGAARARVTIVEALLARQRAMLGAKEAPIARLLAALDSLARRPAIAMIAQPGSLDDLVHVRAVLGGAVPVIRARTAALRRDLAETRRLRADAALASASLAEGRRALADQRRALAVLQARHSERALAIGRDALTQSDRAIALGESARDIVDRMALVEDRTVLEARLEVLPGPPAGPAEALPAAAPVYRLPVVGRLVTGLGELSPSGVRARGLTFETAPDAPVAAPAAGRVVFARSFRRYGTVVILDHGAGWSSTITGLARVAVRQGQPVTAGARLGTALVGEAPRVTVELRRHGRPVDLAALVG